MTIDKVKAKNFYQDAGDKTLLNWCLYEYANVLYTKIEESPKLASYRKKHSAKEIEELADMLHIGKNKAYELLNTEKIKSIKIGRIHKIPKINIIKYIEKYS
jgi:excisionase family DNA binding protein